MKLLSAVAVFLALHPIAVAPAVAQVPTPVPPVAPVSPAAPMPFAVPVPPRPQGPMVAPVLPMPPVPVKPFEYDGLWLDEQLNLVNAQIEQMKNLKFDFKFGAFDELTFAEVAQDAARAAQAPAREAAEAARRAAEDVRRDLQFRVERVETGNTYNSGLNYLNQRQYDRAITQFDRVIAQKDARADGAMYHKAFAQFRSGRSQEALETIAALRRDFPQSRYLGDARVLEADIRRLGGQPISPSVADDDEIKLLAIQGLQRSEQAVTLLDGVLTAANSLALKKRALFVLAQNEDPRARAILLRYAKGEGNPDLQLDAIRYLISRRDQTTSRDLREIYDSTQDQSVKLAIIGAYQSSSDKPALLTIVQNKSASADLRGRAILGLSSLLSPDELWSIYQQEPDAAIRMSIVSALGSARALDHLSRVARTDADASVRRRAVSVLGGMRGEQGAKARQALLDLYSAQTETSIRTSIISALNNTEGADALVALARKETTLELKRVIVQRLSELAPRSKVAADYLMEVIK